MKKKIIILLVILIALLGSTKLIFKFFDNSTNIKGIEKVHISLLDWDGENYSIVGGIANGWELSADSSDLFLMIKKAGKDISGYSHNKYANKEHNIHFRFTYLYRNGIKITTTYHIQRSMLSKIEGLKNLYESKAFKSKFLMKNNNKIMNENKYIGRGVYMKEGDEFIDNPEELINKMDMDFMKRSYSEQIDTDNYYESISIAYGITVEIYKTDKHTLKWLDKNGYEIE